MPDPQSTRCPSVRASVILFLGFLAICLGLGYPAVSRYDPRQQGNYDAGLYYHMVLGQQVGAPAGLRLLTPTLARGVHHGLSRFDLGAWDRVLCSLLLVNAVFTSLSAVMLMRMAAVVCRDTTVAALSPWIYLSSFAVVNFNLAGLVDAGEGFFLIALLLALLRGRWSAVAALIAVGALAKETVVPFGICAMVVWWVVARVRGDRVPSRKRFALAAIPAALLLGLLSIFACRYLVDVPPYEAHRLSWPRLTGMFPAAIDCLFARTQVYVFAFLLPLGIPRLRSIPAPLLAASGCMALLAWLLGAYAQIGDNLHRPLFNTLGPVLVISSAIFISNLVSGNQRNRSEV